MLRRAIRLKSGTEDDNADSGAETAESDCSKMSSTSSDLMAVPIRETLLMTMHLLANPGASLLLQHTLDRLLKWVCPGLRIFHVSERACPLRDAGRSRLDRNRSHPSPLAGCPSLAVTLFLHEAYGEERILCVLDFLQRPPWQYHHTESVGGSRAGGIHITSPADALLQPYLLPSRDFYSLGRGMPVWGVRPVHCGAEVLRVTLHSAYDNFEDTVRLYETVLRRRAEEQKAGFCWFTLHSERGLCLQLALKQLSPGVSVEPCDSAVLQFRVEEIGQLVPLLPNPCTPISATRWQTEDLDGNKMLFQVKGQSQCQVSTASAFSLNCPNPSSRGLHGTATSSLGGSRFPQPLDRGLGGPVEGSVGSCPAGGGSVGGCHAGLKGWANAGCHREERRGLRPAPFAAGPLPLLQLARELETDVDTGFAVEGQQERPAAVGASALETVTKDLYPCLPDTPREARTRGGVSAHLGGVSVTSSHCASATLSGAAEKHRIGRTLGMGLPRQAGEQSASQTPQHAALQDCFSASQAPQHAALQDEFFI
ncbi:hypothetical protein AAFF_G00131030 [Aldrovandia affinis]|uniref:FAM124 domain-containing protein n=1 Tax=Aldrovandia affinis TaxID=143900 RepID=A0AAD7WAC0_9TELE|nr:hypothetical protein AAFF_G00131030 [Aldrovandia affinis]